MDPVLIYVAIFGLFLGLVVGMTSIGKGLIGTPGLVFLGMTSPMAVGTVGVAGVFMMISSAIKHLRNKNVNVKAVVTFSVTALPGSYFFALYKEKINDVVPLTNIIAVAIILSVITLVYKFFLSKKDKETPADAKYDESKASVGKLLVLGAILGFFIGATSISGSLIVIAFMLILKMPETLAIGTTNCVAIFSLAAASAAHITGGNVDWVKLAAFTPAVMIGAYIGSGLTTKVPQKPMRVIILSLLLVAAVAIFFKNGGTEKMLVGTWKCGTSQFKDVTFKDDHTLSRTYGDTVENGEWTVEKSTLTLRDASDEATTWTIVGQSETELVLKGKDGEQLILRRAPKEYRVTTSSGS